MVKYWLVIHLLIPGSQPIVLADFELPDINACWAEARAAVEYAMDKEGPFEFAASCAVEKLPPVGDPA